MATLVPGAGDWSAFNTIVAGLSPGGSGKYSDAKAIARWALVPYQTVAVVTKIGVVAAQGYGVTEFGIDKVDFFLNGGAAASAAAPTLNTDRGWYDFNVDFDPDTVSDGLVEIRAIVYPVKGLHRVLQGAFDANVAAKSRGEYSMWLNSNFDASLSVTTYYVDAVDGDDADDGSTGNPVQTLYQARVLLRTGSQANGGVIKLREGDYTIPAFAGDPFKDYDRWLVVEPDTGVDRADVHIAAAETEHFQGIGVKLTRLRNLTIDPGVNITQAGDVSGYVPPALWFDGCDRDGGAIEDGGSQASSSSYSRGLFHTGCDVHDMNTAFNGAVYVVGNTIYSIGEDVYRDCQGLMAANDIDGVTQPGDNHSDLIQIQNGFGTDSINENTIHYNDKAKHVGQPAEAVQGPFCRSLFAVGTHKDFAFINCDYSYGGNGQFLHSMSHVLIWHCTWMVNQALGVGGNLNILKDPPDSADTEVANLSLKCSVLYSLSLGSGATLVDEPTAADTTWADDNHFMTSSEFGTNSTGGGTLAEQFNGPNTENYSPKATGELVGRTASALVPTDILGTARLASLGAIGAYEEDSVPVAAPDLSITDKLFSEARPFSAVVTNVGDLVDSVVNDDPTKTPVGVSVAVVAGVITISASSVTRT